MAIEHLYNVLQFINWEVTHNSHTVYIHQPILQMLWALGSQRQRGEAVCGYIPEPGDVVGSQGQMEA